MKMKARSHHRANHLVDSDLCGDVAKYSDGLKKNCKGNEAAMQATTWTDCRTIRT